MLGDTTALLHDNAAIVFAAGMVLVWLVPHYATIVKKRLLKRNVKEFCKKAAGANTALSGKTVLAIANPHGGSRTAVSTFHDVVAPMCKAVGVEVELVITTHAGHAETIAESIPSDVALVISLSGDGMLHEIVAGMMKNSAGYNHKDQKMRHPVAIVPCGSSNGMAKSLYSTTNTFEATKAILLGSAKPSNLITAECGQVTAFDVAGCSFGVVVDVCQITEVKLRWMGYLPFGALIKDLVAAVYVIVAHKMHPVTLQFLPAALTREDVTGFQGYTDPEAEGNAYRPKLKQVEPKGCDGQGWRELADSCMWCELINVAWLSYDILAGPGLPPAQGGTLDVIISRGHSRWEIMGSFLKAEEGGHVEDAWFERYKLKQMVVTPGSRGGGGFAMSGEPLPFPPGEPVLVTAHEGRALLWR